MKHLIKLFFIILLSLVVYACCKDEDTGVDLIPVRDRAEQYLVDKALIEDYLKNHYIDDEATDPETLEVFVKSIPEGNPANKTTMWDDSRRRTIYLRNDDRDFSVFPPALINDPVDYAVHYFSINPSAPAIEPNDPLSMDFDYSKHAHVTDSVFVNYKGWKTRDNQVFDKVVSPVWFNLRTLVSGFRQIIPYMKTGDVIPNSNSPVPFTNFGSVIVVIPSGLGYFANPRGAGLQVYDNLLFQVSTMRLKRNDWDNDCIPNVFDRKVLSNPYIPTILENKPVSVNINGSSQTINQNMIYDLWTNNDTDNDGIPNFIDNDDDGDNVLTKREIRFKLDPNNPDEVCKMPFSYDPINGYQYIPKNDSALEVHLNAVVRNNIGTTGVCIP